LEFKKAKRILNKNKDIEFTDEEIIEVFAKLTVSDLLKSRNNKNDFYNIMLLFQDLHIQISSLMHHLAQIF
jgi:hypothetical protein